MLGSSIETELIKSVNEGESSQSWLDRLLMSIDGIFDAVEIQLITKISVYPNYPCRSARFG